MRIYRFSRVHIGEMYLVFCFSALTLCLPFALCIEWGSNFGSINSTNVKGCSLIQDYHLIDSNKSSHLTSQWLNRCSIKKNYISSPYELKQLAIAGKLSLMSSFNERRKFLVDFITSQEEINAANIWLKRVESRMRNSQLEQPTDEDYMYLSRFEITKSCNNRLWSQKKRQHGLNVNTTWTEWIEPITVHARHPFSISGCGNGDIHDLFSKKHNYSGATNIYNVDYILTQSPASFYLNTTAKTEQMSDNRVKNFLFDAGTSTFQSSLIWFMCAYTQRKIYMDSIHAWEVTLLEPNSFWKEVPSSINYRYHFYNIPISSNSMDKDSPLRIIKALATIDDFVAFKLDIDSPMTEIPIALEVISNPKVAELIDEFFFELHFQCELLGKACWAKVPDYHEGLRMDRYNAMKLFITYRNLGIRSHFWP